MRGVEARFEEARLRRDSLYQRGMIVSPVTLAYQAFSQVAGNDELRQQQFLAEAERHHGTLRDFFQRNIQAAALADEKSACVRSCLYGYGFNSFAEVPHFTASHALTEAHMVPCHFYLIHLWIAALAGLATMIVRYMIPFLEHWRDDALNTGSVPIADLRTPRLQRGDADARHGSLRVSADARTASSSSVVAAASQPRALANSRTWAIFLLPWCST